MSARTLTARLALALLVSLATACGGKQPPSPAMSMFVTSVGLGDGGNLGGLTGADAHCQRLADAVGSRRTWHAYLSAPAREGHPAISARSRIGNGPWFNQHGDQIAASLETLHSNQSGIDVRSALTEQGKRVSSNIHDMLTGSTAQGQLATNWSDTTCGGWTSHSVGRVMLGHSDGAGGQPNSLSWNAAHLSSGCSAKALDSTGGAGLFYCFAID